MNRRRGPRIPEHLFMVLAAAAVGLVSALGAVGFRFMIRTVQDQAFGGLPELLGLLEGALPAGMEDPLEAAAHLPWFWLLIVPALGASVAAPLIYYFAREAKGHGVPEVMESIALRGGEIRPRVALIKAVASAFTIGSGGSVGREGPIVQIGSALGSTVGQMLRVPERQLRTLVGCGAASGIAAAFNAPIAGALFAVEIILGDFAVTQFSPIVIASVVATVVSRAFLGDFPAFVVPEYRLVSPFELLPYMGVGVLAGLLGIVFILVLYASEDFFDRLRIHEMLKLPIGGIAVGMIGIFLPNVFGVGYSTINGALTGELGLGLLGVLILAKLSATCLTLGSGGSGGIFAPSLFLGAVAGGFFGTIVHQVLPAVTGSSGAYALVTMGAVVAATTHAPITAIIIIFELTQDITIIPPLMAACVVSTLISSYLHPESIYTLKLVRRGIDLFGDQEPNVLKTLLVHDVMESEPETVAADASFNDVLNLVVQSPHATFYVVNTDREMLGAIALSELRRLIFERDSLRDVVVAADLIDREIPVLRETDDLDLVMQLFAQTQTSELPVSDPATGALVGCVRQPDLVAAYNRAVLSRDLAGGMTRRVGMVSRVHRVELGNSWALQEIRVPGSFIGRSLRELDLRAHLGVQVLLVRSLEPETGETAVDAPDPDQPLTEGLGLVVVGRNASLDRLEAS
jgi:CIC family chloride channel protein